MSDQVNIEQQIYDLSNELILATLTSLKVTGLTKEVTDLDGKGGENTKLFSLTLGISDLRALAKDKHQQLNSKDSEPLITVDSSLSLAELQLEDETDA